MTRIEDGGRVRGWIHVVFCVFQIFFFFSFSSFSFLFKEHLVLIFGIFCFVKIVRIRSGNVQGHSGSIRRTGQVRMTRGYFQN